MNLLSSSLGYEYLSPSRPLGILILIVGVIFTTMIFYIFINVNSNVDSLAEKKRNKTKKLKQEEKIARLYPKNKSI